MFHPRRDFAGPRKTRGGANADRAATRQGAKSLRQAKRLARNGGLRDPLTAAHPLARMGRVSGPLYWVAPTSFLSASAAFCASASSFFMRSHSASAAARASLRTFLTSTPIPAKRSSAS